jgi:hypothetical protein
MLIQVFAMFSDVPADAYSVELGRLEPPESRGQILATGQRIRFTFCIIAGLIQTFLLNGTSTNVIGCEIGINGCWEWGLNVNQYYGLLFAIVCVLFFPILFLKELKSSTPPHGFFQFLSEVWETMQNRTFLYIMFYVVGSGALTNFYAIVNYYLQYYVINLSNFQAGIDATSSSCALVLAIWLFQTCLIDKNWRWTQYGSTIISSIMLMLWLPAYFNIFGLRNAWYTIFIDLDVSFVAGISQVLFSLSVIELAKPGQEATTYELIVTASKQHFMYACF